MLERIALPASSRETTRLGFGGSGVMGGLSERESLALLETAYDAGIRHFDVAPSYGHGQAERCLGKFLRGKTEQVTVATKYGILPPPHAGLMGMARSMVRPAARRVPAIRKQVAQAAAGLKTKARFCAEEAGRSLDRSLRELGIDRIDMCLLHEATADDLDDSDLLPFLRQAQQQGRIGAYGVGGERSHLDALWQRHPEYCNVLQFQWSILEPRLNFPGAFRIHYRVVPEVVAIRKLFRHHPTLCRRWSDKVDADLAEPQTLIALVLAAALSSNPNGIVLFFSRVPSHIQANVSVVSESAWEVRGKRFLELLPQERGRIGLTHAPSDP